jgi:cell division protein FtsL
MDATFDNPTETRSSTPSSRRLRRRRKPIMGLFLRYVLMLTLCSVLVFACVLICLKIARPYSMQAREQAQISALNSRLMEDETSNRDLQQQIVFVQSRAGADTAARAQGFLAPGEVSIAITVKPPAPVDNNQPGFESIMQSAWRHLSGR